MRLTIDTPVSQTAALRAGALLMVPGALFLAANLLNDAGVGLLYAPIEAVMSTPTTRWVFNLVSPLLFLGGPALALILNLLAIGTLDLSWSGRQVAGSVTIAPRAANLAMAAGGTIVFAAFLAYALVENITIVYAHV